MLSAVEGLEVGTSAFKPYVVPIAVAVLRRALRAPGARHARRSGRLFGPVTLLWFLAIGAAGIYGIVAAAGHPGGAQPAARARVPHRPRHRIVRRARRGGARGHRRGGALCRHGPLRQGRGAHRLVQPGGAGAGAELLRPGRAAACVQPDGGAESVLPAASRLGALPDGRARHRWRR